MMGDPETTRGLREAMVENQIARRGIRSISVLEAFRRVPRHLFVPEGTPLESCYGDFPLPIGFGQTVSQPYVAALMLEMLGCGQGSRVLEIGSGSGYVLALLLFMGMDPIGIEIVPRLAARARRIVAGVTGASVRIVAADGVHGLPRGAPYDGILVSAAPAGIPEGLSEQLAEGGTMVIPVGTGTQRLARVSRHGGGTAVEYGEYVRFVPLVEPGTRRRT